MTLREEFENYINTWNKISIEKLFASSNQEYIKWLENKYNNYECDCSDTSLEDFDGSEIIWHLNDTGFDFIGEVTEDEMKEYLENKGYIISERIEPEDEVGLDLIDYNRLEEIKNLFIYSSFAEREKIYNKVIKL